MQILSMASDIKEASLRSELEDKAEFRACALYGGVNKWEQLRVLHEGTDLLVATPGRLLECVASGEVSVRLRSSILPLSSR